MTSDSNNNKQPSSFLGNETPSFQVVRTELKNQSSRLNQHSSDTLNSKHVGLLNDPELTKRELSNQIRFMSAEKPLIADVTRVGRTISILLLIALTTVLVVPGYRRLVWSKVRTTGKRIGLIDELGKTTDISSDVGNSVSADESSGASDSQKPDAKIRECETRIRASITTGISDSDRPLVADCYILREDYAHAEEVLRPLISGFQPGQSEPQGATADAYITLTFIFIKEGQLKEAARLIGPNCLRWQLTAACVAKGMLALAKNQIGVDNSLEYLFSEPRLSNKSTTYLALSSAVSANIVGDFHLSDRRLKLAFKRLTQGDTAAAKLFYETKALIFLQRNDDKKLRSVSSKGLRALNRLGFDSAKLQLGKKIAEAKNQPAAIKRLLGGEFKGQNLLNDFDWVEALGPMAIRSNLLDNYAQLLNQSHDFYLTHFHTTEGIERNLSIWTTRLALARGDSKRALQILSSYAKSFGADFLCRHLTGIAKAMTTAGPAGQLMAAKEFQSALKLKRNWESAYALGTSLVQAGKVDSLPPVVAELSKLSTTKGQKYWLDMLAAESFIALTNYPEAQKILHTWRKSQPGRLTPMKLQLQLYQKTGKKSAAETIREDLARAESEPNSQASDESLASPVGPMALGRRPIY